MSKGINPAIKNEILEKIKNEGLSVNKSAQLYSVSEKTIYRWLNEKLDNGVSILQHNKLKKENENLYKIIGKLTVSLKKEGKN